MNEGVIKTLTDKGFGFISREGHSKDVFFHAKNLRGVRYEELQKGDTVTFDVEQGDKGAFAVNIQRA